MTIDWSKAPEGTQWHIATGGPEWFKRDDDVLYMWMRGSYWQRCASPDVEIWERDGYSVTPRPSEPKPYTRDEALQFLVERLDSWPTDIADAPLCPGWGWASTLHGNNYLARTDDFSTTIYRDEWQQARPDFVPFTSVEDAQPATAKQSAPSGKGDPILGMVLTDLTNRALEGREKYGEALKANNGRNALWDAYQEALDLAMYLRQAIEEQHRAQTDR